MDIHSLDAFSKHRHFDFEPIQEMVNRNVFSFALPDARNMMREVTKHTKKSQLVEVVDRYSVYVDECIESLAEAAGSGWTHQPLRQMLLGSQFRALFNTIFGRSDSFAFNSDLVSSGLDRFHKAFNFLWLGFPCWLFPDPHKALKAMVEAHPDPEELAARPDASAYIRAAVAKLQEFGGDRNVVIGHNLVYTHVNYNSVKVTYWALAHLASHPEAQAELLQEAQQLIEAGSAEGDSMAEVLLDDIIRLPILGKLRLKYLRKAAKCNASCFSFCRQRCQGNLSFVQRRSHGEEGGSGHDVQATRWPRRAFERRGQGGDVPPSRSLRSRDLRKTLREFLTLSSFILRSLFTFTSFLSFSSHLSPSLSSSLLFPRLSFFHFFLSSFFSTSPSVLQEFRFDRFIDAEFFKDGLRVGKPLLPYGTLCPGQQMSTAQVKVFIFSFVTSFEFRFDGPVPEYNRESYGHEILPVLQDQPLSFRTRASRRRLRLRFV